MSDSKGLTPVTVLLPNELYEALQAKLAREQKEFAPVAVALVESYVNQSASDSPDFQRCLAHVEDIMQRYDSTLRALAK